jgi:hypothetical protein
VAIFIGGIIHKMEITYSAFVTKRPSARYTLEELSKVSAALFETQAIPNDAVVKIDASGYDLQFTWRREID